MTPHAMYQPSDDEIDEIATRFALKARSATSPGRSIGALIRWQYRSRWSDEACDRLLCRALELLDAGTHSTMVGRVPELPPIIGAWLTVEQVGEITGRTPQTIKRRLRLKEGRRDYGWPWWDGHRWMIPSVAVDPAQRAMYMAGLPQEEPHTPPDFVES